MSTKSSKRKVVAKAESDPVVKVKAEDGARLKRKDYDQELERLHVELVKLQRWVVATGAKVCVIFEGRDGAGKGGTIKAIAERVSPRVFRVIALPAPTEPKACGGLLTKKLYRASYCPAWILLQTP